MQRILLMQQIENVLDRIKDKYENARVSFSSQVYNTEDDSVQEITCMSLEELINRVAFLYRKYTKIVVGERSYDVVAVDEQDYRRKRDFIQNLTFNLIVLAKPGQKLVKGSEFVRNALKSNYIVINPHTTDLCVSFCIATLQYYRETEIAGSLYSYLQRNARKIAKQNKIQEGADWEQVQKLSAKYEFTAYSNSDLDGVEVTEPIFVVLDGHCYLVLPNDARAKHIKAMISPYSDEDEQVEMERWEPKENKLEFATWDLEWYTHEGKQHPYMFGLYYVIGDKVEYFDYDDAKKDSIYKQFLD